MRQPSAVGRWPAAAVVSSVTLILDQGSKWTALEFLSPGVPVDFLGHAVRLNLIHNPGIVFGLPARIGVCAILIVIALAILLEMILARRTPSRDTAPGWTASPLFPIAIGLSIGGAIGNLTDRIRFGAVVDFIDLGFWPVFNIADIALTCAAVLLVVSLFKSDKKNVSET